MNAPRRRSAPGWRASAAVVALAVPWPGGAQERTLLVGGTLLDGVGPPRPGARLAIADGRFVCVSDSGGCPSRPGDRVVDLEGRWITPGLIDTHVHLEWEVSPERMERNQRLRFALGITTTRDAGTTSPEAALAARERAAGGENATPRLIVAGTPGSAGADGSAAAVGARTQALIDLGVDQIKIKDFADEGWAEAIRVSRDNGVVVFGHYWSGPPEASHLAPALGAGIHGLSHLLGFAPFAQAGPLPPPPDGGAEEIWSWRKGLWETASAARLDSLVSVLVAHDVWIEPILASEFLWDRPLHPPASLGHLRHVPPSLGDLVRFRDGAVPVDRPRFPEAYTRQTAFVRAFHEAGGRVVAGSDGPGNPNLPGLDLHTEIQLLDGAGLGPLEGLRAATWNAALAVGRPDLGRIAEGQVADALVLRADPSVDPRGLLEAETVIKSGVFHAVDDLRAPFRTAYSETVRALWIDRLRRFALPLLVILVTLTGAVALGLRRRRRRRAAG